MSLGNVIWAKFDLNISQQNCKTLGKVERTHIWT